MYVKIKIIISYAYFLGDSQKLVTIESLRNYVYLLHNLLEYLVNYKYVIMVGTNLITVERYQVIT